MSAQLDDVEAVRADTPPQAPASGYSVAHRVWLTFVFALVAMLAAIDRNIFSILLVPIQKTLHVGDAAMGLLSGTAFLFVLATTGLPMAWLSDRTSRRNILAGAVAIWSAMTVACGFTSSYLQLMLARFGVAAGEAAQTPATYSMLGDVFPPASLGKPISFIAIATMFGITAGNITAGLVSERYGWHAAMMVCGLPGLLVALLIWRGLREPRRGGLAGPAKGLVRAPNLWASLGRIVRIRTLWTLLPGSICLNLAFSGWLIWLPPLMMRVHHLGVAQMAATLGFTGLIAGMLANAFAGVVTDYLSARGARWRMYFAAFMALCAAPLMAGAVWSLNTTVAVTFMTGFTFTAAGLATVTGAANLSIAPANLRATMTAVNGLVVQSLGAVGPAVIGLLDDRFRSTLGDHALRYTLLTLPVCLGLSGVFFALSSRTIDRDVAAAAPPGG